MGLSLKNLNALRKFPPSSFNEVLHFFEFLKYETKQYRSNDSIEREALFEIFINSPKISQSKKTKPELRKIFNDSIKKLDSLLFLRVSDDIISEIKWAQIDEFCDLLRLVERSDERKIRWALYHLFSSGKREITQNQIIDSLGEIKITNIVKLLKKIQRDEYTSGLNAIFDGKKFVINHELDDKVVAHYLADAIEEQSRRSPGELEKEILDLLDEGSYSNQEIAKSLSVDEAMVSRSISKLRDNDEIVLSSFGQKGSRYYTTNCENCPFGTTQASCRKEALSYIINSFKETFDIDLNSTDFDSIHANQAILKIKRIVMIAKKEKNTKLERNISENLSHLLAKVVDKSLEVKTSKTGKQNPKVAMEISSMSNLPMLYQLGLLKGANTGIDLMDKIFQTTTKSLTKEDHLKMKKEALTEARKILKILGLYSSKKKN